MLDSAVNGLSWGSSSDDRCRFSTDGQHWARGHISIRSLVRVRRVLGSARLALPLLIIAEIVTQRRLGPMLQQFLQQNLIPEHAMGRFESAVSSASRLLNSLLSEVLIVLFVYGVGILIVWRQYLALDTATWYATPYGEGSRLTLAGIWYGYVSLPIFRSLLARWYFRLFLWARLLWQVSRIELNLIPTHPDRLAGLSLPSAAAGGFTVLAAAHGTLLAGWLGTRVVFLGASLTQFKTEIAVIVIFVLCITLGPLLVFAPQLSRVKRNGLRECRTLAARYVNKVRSEMAARPRARRGAVGG